jgi:Tfp pilus assembly ATPase PilU
MEGRALELHDYMRTAGKGQHTFDQDLLAMHRQELISNQEALLHATNPESLGMALRGISSSKSITEPGKSNFNPPKPPAPRPAVAPANGGDGAHD